MELNSASELFLSEMQDLYDAEKQLLRALPRIAKSVSDQELAEAFREHVEVTRGQVQRIEQVFEMLGQRAKSHPCKGMKGLVEEAQEMMEGGKSGLTSVAMAGAGRKVEHYEIAGYQAAQETARGLGQADAAKLLAESLNEEMEMERRLKQLSSRILKEAQREGAAEEGEEEGGSRGGRSRGGSARKTSAKSASQRGQSANGRSNGAQASSSSSGERKSRSNGKQSGGKQSGGKQSGGKQSGGRSAGRGGGSRSASSQTTTDHEVIREWAEQRGAKPACVKGTGGRKGKSDTGMIRLDFPGFSGADSLQPISWEEWFEQFDKNNLALLFQEKTASGQPSNFNKLVSRD